MRREEPALVLVVPALYETDDNDSSSDSSLTATGKETCLNWNVS